MKYAAGRTSPVWNTHVADRFGFYLFLALALHGFLILAISFTLPERSPPRQTLDITLAQFSQEKPDEADFFAQTHQQGSGEAEERLLPSTTEEAPLERETITEQSPQPQPLPATTPEPQPSPSPAEPVIQPDTPAAPQTQTGAQPQLTTTRPQPERVARPQQQPSSQPTPSAGSSASLLARSMEIASIQAQLDLEQQTMARKPRVRRLTSSPSTMAHDDAIYLENWRRRIESIGNLNYPEEARRRGIHGSLRLLVAIRPDGSVANIEILQSSGHRELDDAAVRIVRMAAPFQPFTNDMRRDTDMLEIIRTWRFENRARVY